MSRRFVSLSVVAGALLQSLAWAAEPDSPQGADEWRGRRVLAASPQVVLRGQPNEQAPAIPVSPGGIWLHVKRAEGDWLRVYDGWIRAADVVRDDRAIGYFTAELAREESAFAYINRSRAWLEQKEFDKAQADVSEALRLDPDNARAYFVRSRIAAAQQRPEDERAACDRALELDPRDPFALHARSHLKVNASDYDGAISDLDLAIESLPRSSWLWSARGFCWHSKGEYDKAFADYSAAVGLDPLDAYAHGELAAICFGRQEFENALRHVENALKAGAKNARALAIRGAVRMQKGELDAALGDLDESIRLKATDYNTFRNRGRVHLLKSRYDAAVTDFTQALSLNANDADSYMGRAETWARKGDRANAVLDLTQYLRLRPNDANAYAQRGWLNKDVDVDAAFNDFNAALEIDPRHVYALLGRGLAWQQKNDLAKAIDDTTAAIDAAPRNAEAYVQRGWLRKGTDLDAALKDYGAALEINPRHVGALLDRAEVWRKLGHREKALVDLTAAIDVDPKNTDAYVQRAYLLSLRGEHMRAIEDLTSALQIKPDNADCLLRRSTQWSLCGNLEKALEDCRAVLAKDPENLRAYGNMAQAHSLAGQSDKALEDYAAALRIDPHDEEIRFHRAVELFNQDKVDLAMADVEEVMRNGKRVADAYNWRGYFLMRLKIWEKALADFNEAIRRERDDAEHWRMRADCWYGMKQFDKAIEDADEALRLDPTLIEAARVRRQALEAKKDPSQAVDPLMAEREVSEDDLVAGLTDAQLAALYKIELQGPDGLKLLFANSGPDDFGPEFISVPARLPMLEEGPMRLKLTGIPGEAEAALYVLLKPRPLPPQDMAVLRTASPAIRLTKVDLDAALADKDVKIAVYLPHAANDGGSPRFQTFSSTRMESGKDPIAEASKYGTVVATLELNDEPFPAVDLQAAEHVIEDDAVVTSLTDEQRARLYELELDGPAGAKMAFELDGGGKFTREFTHFPVRLPMLDDSAMRFKLTGVADDADAAAYVLVRSKRLPTKAIAMVRAGKAALTLTKVELDTALAGNDVTKTLVLRRDESKPTAKPELEAASSTELDPEADPIAAASRRGAIVAVLLISKTLPPPFPVTFDDEELAMCVSGPEGLALTHEASTTGQFDARRDLVPARFRLRTGAAKCFKLSGPPIAAKGPVFAFVTLIPTLPPEASLVDETELPIEIAQADLDAALTGKRVTRVVFLAIPEKEGEAPRVQSLSDANGESVEEVAAEASKRGSILSVLMLSRQLSDLPTKGFERTRDDDSAAVPPPADAKAPSEGQRDDR